MPTKNAFISHKRDFLLQVPFVPFINSQQRMICPVERRWFLGCCGWRAKHLSRSLWSFARRETEDVWMKIIVLFVCWLCNKIKLFQLVGLGKILKSLFRLRRVSTWALSVFFVQNSCWGSCRIKDLTMHDICYQILQGREVSCEKRGDFERWEVQELVGKWTTRLSAKTRDFGAVWATFSCYMLRYFFIRQFLNLNLVILETLKLHLCTMSTMALHVLMAIQLASSRGDSPRSSFAYDV